MKEIDELTLPENNRSSVKPVSVEAAVDTVIQRRNRRQARVLFNLDDARNTNPDQENVIRKNAAAVGMPVDAARAFPDDAARRANALRLQKMRLAQDFPHTMAFFEDINNARIAHDDIDNLKETESVFTNISDFGRSFAAGVVSDFFGNIAQGVEENILRSQYGAMSELQAMTGGDELSQSGIADEQGRKALMGTSRLIKEDIGEYVDIPKERRNRLRNQIARGLGQVAGQIAVMAATGGYGGMFFLGMQGSGQMSESLAEDRKRLLEKGINPSIAGEQAAFLGGSAVTALTEKFGLDFMTGKYTPALIRLAEKYGAPAIMKMVENRGVRFATGALLAGMGEGTQEVTENLGQTWLRTALVDRSIQVPDAEQLWDEFLVGGLVGLITHGAVNARSIIKSGENREIVNAATDVAARAKLNERDSEAYGKYFKGVAGDSKADGAFIRKDAWDAYYQSENMDPALAAERYGITNYSEAAESGSYLEMPLERHGSDFAKTDAAIKLKDHTKYFSDPEVVTPYELALLEADQARTEKELQKTLADINVTQDRRRNLEDAIDAITEDVSAQLQARWGESTSNTQATLMARWFSVSRMRDELSKDPEATDEKIIRRIAGEWQKKGLDIHANVLPDILTKRKNVDVSVDPMLEKLRRNEWPKERDVYGQSLMEYIRKKGGIRPDDITRDLVRNRQLPRSILNEKGMGADELASLQDVLDFGLDTETMQGDDALLDALVAEYTTGEKRYSIAQLNSELLSEAQALNDLSHDLAAAGIDLSTNTDNAAVREALSKYYEEQNGENTREEPETSETDRYEQRGFTESDVPTAEERAEANRQYDEIEKKYKGTPLWMKAPNGEATKLTERQWVQVRTPNFRKWFGDWETARQRAFLDGEPVVSIAGGRFTTTDGTKPSVLVKAYFAKMGNIVKGTVLGDIEVTNRSIKDAIAHNIRGKLDVFEAVPDVLKKGTVIALPDERKSGYVVSAPVAIGDGRYIVSVVVKKSADGLRFYTHDVIAKESLLNGGAGENQSGRTGIPPKGDDIRSVLKSILSVNPDEVSKVVDENGEPLVMYHGTTAQFDRFDKRRIRAGREANSRKARGFYFSARPEIMERYSGYGRGQVMPVFLNLRHPIEETRGKNTRVYPVDEAIKDGTIKDYDGVIAWYEDVAEDAPTAGRIIEIVAFEPNQIKSATDNVGTYSKNPNILYQFIGEQGAQALDKAQEATTRLDNLGVAREMETAGKDAKAIKFATGWERGADGKWRYEIDDGSVRLEDALAETMYQDFAPLREALESDVWKRWEAAKAHSGQIVEDLIEGKTGAKERLEAHRQLGKTPEVKRVIDEQTRLARRYGQVAVDRLQHVTDKTDDAWKKQNIRRVELTLGDILDNPALFQTYPALKNMPVFFGEPEHHVYGTYFPASQYIELNQNAPDPAGTLLHEVQHAIQHIEGFASGANPWAMDDFYSKNDVYADFETLYDLYRRPEWKEKLRKEAALEKARTPKTREKRQSELEQAEEAVRQSGLQEEIDAAIVRVKRRYGKGAAADMVDALIREPHGKDSTRFVNMMSLLNATENIGFEKYRRVAGEVEARNVSRRMGMTPEERLASLAEETEDVVREDQIILRDGLESAAAMSEESALSGDVARLYRKLAEDDDMFRYPVSAKKDLADIAADAQSDWQVSDPHRPANDVADKGAIATWDIIAPDGQSAWVHAYRDIVNGKPRIRLAIDASQLNSGKSGGNELVTMVMNFAYNNGFQVEGDRAGYTEKGKIRAYELMLSSALRFNTTRHLAPSEQLAKELDWEEGNDLKNISQLIDITYKNTLKAVPEIADFRYNMEHDHFEKKDKNGRYRKVADPWSDDQNGRHGRTAENPVSELSPKRRSTEASVGSTTLKRAVLVQTLRQSVASGSGQTGRDASLAGDTRLQTPVRLKGTLLERILYQSQSGTPKGKTRGATIIHPDRTMRIELFKDADFSTFAHETAHFMLEDFADMARSENASQYAKDEFARICRYLNADPAEKFTREQHEKFAQSFEKYLMEGKAPSLELKDIFRKFKIWLQDIYRVLKLHVTLNKDIRDVFDRMLATDREIEVARSVNRYADTMFATAEDMGVSKEVFETYKKLNSDSIKDAQEKMLVRIMRFVRQKKTKEYKEELEAVKGQVKSAYREEPASIAIRTLGDPDSEVRLEKNDLVGRYGKAYLGKLPRNGKNRLYTDEGGVDADTAAELLGYPSGDAMLEAITTLPSETEYVDAEAERIMRERYGDLLNSDYLPDLAQEVLHNEARQDMLAHELRALRKLQKAGEAAVKGKERIEKESFGMIKKRIGMAKEAAKLFSERTIDNKAVSQVRPYTYLQAARKAARESFEFLAKKQYEKAAEAKYRELISTILYSEAVKARSGIDSDRKLFSRILSGSEKKLAKTRLMNPVYRARYILARHGIGNRADDWIEKLQTAGKYEDVDTTKEPSKDWKEMSFSEFTAMADEVKGLWELSRRDKVVEIDGKRLEVAAVAESIRDEIEKFGVADEEHVEKTGISKLLDNWSTSMKRVEQQFDLIGGEDGVLMTKVFQPMKDAAVRSRLKQAEVMDRMQVAISKLKFKPGKISAPELIDKETGRPHVFGRGEICGAAEVFGALLHTGNESNYRKLLLGRGWATVDAKGRMNASNWDAFVERMVREGVITKTHYDAAQAIWDEFEALKPLTQKANKAIYGTYFKEIGIDGIVTPFGKYKGGYVPAKTDKNVVPDAQLNELKDIDADKVQSMMPLSQPGFTKSRSETYAEALDMNPRTIIGATNRIVSFAYIAPVYNDVRKILQHDSVKNAMHRYDPGFLRDVVSPWMNRARQQTATTDLNDPGARGLATFRSRAGAMFMFNNVKNVVQSSADFLVAASEVKPGNLMAAVLNHDRKAIAEKSEYMRSRFGKSQIAMMDNIDSILIDAGTLKKADRWLMQHAYWMQQLVDDRMSAITWTAAYNDAIQDGKSELQAIRHADRIVRKVFASQNAEDVSNIEAGTAFKRLFTQFSGFFIVRSNLVATELGKIAREAGAKGSDSAATKALKILANKKMKTAILLLTKIAIPAIVDTELALLLKGLMPGDDDWMRDMFIGSAGYVSGLGGPYANLLGESVINVANVATGGKVSSYDSRLASAPAISILEDVLKQSALIAKGGITPERIMKIGTDLTVMPIAPVVPMQVTRQAVYLAGVAGGKIKPTGPVDFIRGAVTGRASPDSRR